MPLIQMSLVEGLAPLSHPPSTRAPRFLVAENNRHLRFVLTYLLGKSFPGARIVTGANGEEALAEFDRHGADMVISERAMPVMDGPALVRQLRTRSCALPILLISDGQEACDEDMANGACSFLTKLEIPTRFTAEVGRLLGGSNHPHAKLF